MNISGAESNMEAMAILMASYYKTLLRNGVPEELARQLTVAYQTITLQTALARKNDAAK